MVAAIAGLHRHKAAGRDGPNNDFYKDNQALLAPAMVILGNELLNGKDPPPSFLEGLIIPLRRKGDSVDAMDYRPISLLQTGYKIFAKLMATRLQQILPKAVGDNQQGFVQGRQMMKTVMMMLAAVSTARAEPDLEAHRSRVILLLDFRKAYDTVASDFLFYVLEEYGFASPIIHMMRKLHESTTAKFLVN